MIDWKALRAKIGGWSGCLTLSEKYILPIFTIQWGCDRAGVFNRPDWRSLNGSIGHGKHDASLYYNGVLFFRVMLPFFVGLHVRWSGAPTSRRQYIQVHLGWKKNGDFAVTLRIQGDAASAEGTYGHNFNQAQGWSCGTH